MIKKILKYLSLILVLCNIPGFLLVYYSPTIGSATSIATSLLLILFFIISKPRQKPIFSLIIFSLLFFMLSGLHYYDNSVFFFKEFARFMIMIICMNEVMARSNYSDIFFVMLLVGLSIIVNGLVFPETNRLYGLVNGRYSGFMLNPNNAGVACMLGMALSYSIRSNFWKFLGQIIFTFAGILTLSRTFLVVWFLLVLISIVKNKKNLIVPILGATAFIIFINFSDSKNFAADRFEAFTSFFEEGEVKTKTISHDTRDQTWALYYDLIFEKPFLGHGFMSFQNKTNDLPGVHNSYLMVIGESGIIPFLIFIGIYIHLFFRTLTHFKTEPYLMYVLLVVLLNLMVSHTYFFNYQSAALTIFIFSTLRKIENKINHLSIPLKT
ncbi:O-antigen ligase family protein [Maribacter flavus]|uniref:O-antigen ligase-related domain-containing protein n=1 Tax=Maribacter flavus TaxID=1658664 RepID=A0A5B2TSD4_9FLAO|nr:O-antigen ligase family protein [Maribacter flavus]KAA2217462.1 hypothetical protein F0361_16105 [Maribacter flavus]